MGPHAGWQSASHALKKGYFAIQSALRLAEMAELVDALGSGPSGGNTVEVRVLSWAPDSKVKPPPGGFTFCVRLGDPILFFSIG